MLYRNSLSILFASLATLGLTGCMDRSLPDAPESMKDIRDDFVTAITDGDQAKVAELLAQEPLLLNEPHPTGQQYPLHVAAALNNEDMIKYLLDEGAEPFVQNDEGEYPADTARLAGVSPEVVALLEAAPQ